MCDVEDVLAGCDLTEIAEQYESGACCRSDVDYGHGFTCFVPILMMLLWIPLKLGGCLDAAWKKNDAASPEYLEIKLDPSAPIDRRKDGITLCEGTYKKRRVKTDKDGGQNERLCDHNVWDKVSGVFFTGRVPRCLFFMDKGDSEKGWYIAQTVQKDGGKDLEYFARTPVTAGGESSPVDAEREGSKAPLTGMVVVLETESHNGLAMCSCVH